MINLIALTNELKEVAQKYSTSKLGFKINQAPTFKGVEIVAIDLQSRNQYDMWLAYDIEDGIEAFKEANKQYGNVS